MMSKAKGLLKFLPVLLNLIPGLSAIKANLLTPPGLGPLFGGIVSGLGCLALLLLWANNKLADWDIGRVNSWAIRLIILCLVCICGYLGMLRACPNNPELLGFLCAAALHPRTAASVRNPSHGRCFCRQ
jgi:hypothetical protein